MSKRSHSPGLLPPSKRRHTERPGLPDSYISFTDNLYDELVLTIFSYLSWVDLCAVQLINRNWARLAVDNELWRKQFLQVYGRTRLRGSRGFLTRPDGRQVKALPTRAQGVERDYKDWKWMFRISSNWRKGRCSVEQIPSSFCLKPSERSSQYHYNTHLLLTGSLIITASSCPSHEPHIFIASPVCCCSIACKSDSHVQCSITTLALDQSPPISGDYRLVSCLSTGEFKGYCVKENQSLSLQIFGYRALQRSGPPVTQAVYHHPLLATLSSNFTVSLYNVGSKDVKLVQTLSSFTSFPPVSLVLSTPSPHTYKLVLSYAVPVYPEHWTAGSTELIICGPRVPTASSIELSSEGLHSSAANSSTPVEDLTVFSTRSIRAVDIPFGWIDERKLQLMREQWSRKVARVTDIRTDGKWVILAPGDRIFTPKHHLFHSRSMPSSSDPSPMYTNDDSSEISNDYNAPAFHSSTGLQLYRLILPPQNSVSSSPPRLRFVRTLHGQTSHITAMALADGRCVSLGLNGSIWVWDLEAGTGAEVAPADLKSPFGSTLGPDAEPIRGSVSFDERRLIIAHGDNVVIRRFDI